MDAYEEMVKKMEEERKAFEAATIYKGFTIAYLREVSEAIFSKEHWKNAWTADVPHQMVQAVYVTTEFYHADTARIEGTRMLTGHIIMSGRGYQAW